AWMNALKPALAERGSVMLNISPHVKGGMLADYVLDMRLALRADGWYEHDELVWLKSSTMPHGRPDVPVRSWESVFWYSRTPRPWSDARRNGTPIAYGKGKTTTDGTAFTATGRGNRLGWGHKKSGGGTVGAHSHSRCKNYVEMGNTAGIPAGAARKLWDHPAPFPPKLADWLVKINTPDGGTVLDPFAGSGTTAVAALRNGFQSVAIEREPEYAQMIVDRYRNELAQRTTLQAGRDKGFRSIGIEADADHVALIRERLEQGSGEPDLFTFGSGG